MDSLFDYVNSGNAGSGGVATPTPTQYQDTSSPDVLPPPPPTGGGSNGDTTGGNIPWPPQTRLPRFGDIQGLLRDQNGNPYTPGSITGGAVGTTTGGSNGTNPQTPAGLQMTSHEQMLQDIFTGKNRNVVGYTNAFPAGFDPSILQQLGDTFDQKKLDQLRPWLEMMGIKLQYKASDNGLPSGRIYLPNGQAIDLNNHGRWGWTPAGGGDGSGGGSGAGNGNGGGNYNPFAGSPLGNLTQRSNDLWNLLWGRANQSLNINRNDPIIRNLSDAFAAMQQRAGRQYLQNRAEKLGSYTNMTAEERYAAQNIAQNTSAFEANLMKDELAARRQEIAQALQLMEGQLTSEEDMSLRLYLGQLDAQIRMLGLSEQMREFNNSLAQRAFEFDVNDEFRRSPLA